MAHWHRRNSLIIPKRYNKFGTVKILTVSRKQWYKNFENPSKFIFIVHLLVSPRQEIRSSAHRTSPLTNYRFTTYQDARRVRLVDGLKKYFTSHPLRVSPVKKTMVSPVKKTMVQKFWKSEQLYFYRAPLTVRITKSKNLQITVSSYPLYICVLNYITEHGYKGRMVILFLKYTGQHSDSDFE